MRACVPAHSQNTHQRGVELPSRTPRSPQRSAPSTRHATTRDFAPREQGGGAAWSSAGGQPLRVPRLYRAKSTPRETIQIPDIPGEDGEGGRATGSEWEDERRRPLRTPQLGRRSREPARADDGDGLDWDRSQCTSSAETPMACGGAELEPCTDGAGSSTAAAHLAPHRPAESECVSSRPRLCQSSWAPHSRIGTLVRPWAGRSAERQRLLPKRQGVPQCKRAARPEPNKEDPSEGVLFDSGATGGIAARALALAGGLSAPILGGGACRRNSVRRSRSRSPGA